MTSTASLFRCSASDITLDRVRSLVGEGQPESLTLEYKEKFSDRLVKSVAAMANSYGGVILVGVTDRNVGDRIVGVPEREAVALVNSCHEKLEPPWQPEIIPVPLPDLSDRYVLVVRVDPDDAPRPLLVSGAAPIRLHGRNAIAGRGRLAELFAELPRRTDQGGGLVPRPQLPPEDDAQPVDFILRTGLQVPLGRAASWTPMSERAIAALATTLNQAPIASALLSWCARHDLSNLKHFDRRGHNRARDARLVWQAVIEGSPPGYPIEAVAEIHLPSLYGVSSSTLQCTLDVVGRVRSVLTPTCPTMPAWRLSVDLLLGLIDGLLATFAEAGVVHALADLAGIDPVVVPQPANMDFVTRSAAAALLDSYGLSAFEDAGSSHGANLLANPALDQRDPADRAEQVDAWLAQIGLDAGLRGMEALLGQLRSGS